MVPTAAMRNGDFREVAAAYSNFRLYNPYTGGAGGVGRKQFANFVIPSNLISPIAQQVTSFYPVLNSDKDLNSNQLLDDYVPPQENQVDRDNYDVKLTWQPRQSQSVWGSRRPGPEGVLSSRRVPFCPATKDPQAPDLPEWSPG